MTISQSAMVTEQYWWLGVWRAGLKAYCVSKNFGWRCRFRQRIFCICDSGLVFSPHPNYFFPFLSLVFFISLANNNCAISRLFHHIVSFYLPWARDCLPGQMGSRVGVPPVAVLQCTTPRLGFWWLLLDLTHLQTHARLTLKDGMV